MPQNTIDSIGAAVLDLRQRMDPLDDAFRVLPRPTHVLPAISAGWEADLRAGLDAQEAALASLPSTRQEDPLARAIVARQMEEARLRLDTSFWAIFLTGYDHSPLGRVGGLFPTLPVDCPAARDWFLEALLSVGGYLDGCLGASARAASRGLTPLDRSLKQALRDWSALERNGGRDLLPAEVTPDFAAKALALFERHVGPAIAQYVAGLERTWTATRGNDRPGLCHVPGGRAQYERLVALHTDRAGAADEIHAYGLAEVARLRDALASLCQMDAQASVEEMLTPRPDEAVNATPADVAAEVCAFLDVARRGFADRFDFERIGPMRSEAIPVHLSAASPPAYYIPGNDARPGTLMVNHAALVGQPRGAVQAMVFHEAIPGHHLQFEIARSVASPDYRRAAWFNSFIEGWGLYCEELAAEDGLYETRVALRGKIGMELLRAARLIVDTGLHARGWSFEKAQAYLMDATGFATARAEREIARYIEYPAQALSYAMGKARLLRLRADVQKALGRDFDLRRFHDEVLRHGAVPLDALADQVTASLQLDQARRSTAQ
jgi:uncharacterized protein (DUF885 family)